jgi:hypothetical protein
MCVYKCACVRVCVCECVCMCTSVYVCMCVNVSVKTRMDASWSACVYVGDCVLYARRHKHTHLAWQGPTAIQRPSSSLPSLLIGVSGHWIFLKGQEFVFRFRFTWGDLQPD